MNARDERLVLLVCGKGADDRAHFLEQLYRAVRSKWRVHRDASTDVTRQKAEIEFLGEYAVIDGSVHDIIAVYRLTTAGIVIASTPQPTFTIENEDDNSMHLRIIDLAQTPPTQAQRVALRFIRNMDADRIGTFSGIGGLVEVGLGSILHAYKIPLKGHFLSSLQNLLLISFGKALNGRGLLRISFVSAMLKAFSPAGGAIRPMIFIFLQGAVFALPVYRLGWNAVAVLLGSVLMGTLTLGISLAMDYLMFGRSIFDAAVNAVGHLFARFDMAEPSLARLLIFAFSLRAVLSVLVFAVAYFGDVLPHISRIAGSVVARKSVASLETGTQIEPPARLSAAVAALRGPFRPKYLVAYLLSVLLMRFFTNLSSVELGIVAIRGLCISYLFFLLMQRIDLQALGARLDKRFGLDLERSLPIAARLIGRANRRGPSASDSR